MKYLFQATQGQFELSNRARPIVDVVKDEKTPPRIRSLLSEIDEIKKYGEARGLRATSNYTEYVKLDRPAAVWVVSACEPLEFKSKEWGFPIVGTFPYLGWFDRGNADEYAQELRKEGLDVDVRGARAYSTLGWFRDAVLSSMIPDGEEAFGDLVNVVLHESVHATVYINGQSYFNESVASFVADKMTPVYLGERLGAQAPEKAAYEKAEQDERLRQRKFHKAYNDLRALYESGKSEGEKRAGKERILSALKSELSLKREVNNATLIQFKTYNEGQPAFDRLLSACGGDWPRFMKALESLKKDGAFPEHQQEELEPVLAPLIHSNCALTG